MMAVVMVMLNRMMMTILRKQRVFSAPCSYSCYLHCPHPPSPFLPAE